MELIIKHGPQQRQEEIPYSSRHCNILGQNEFLFLAPHSVILTCDFFWIPDSRISRCMDFQISTAVTDKLSDLGPSTDAPNDRMCRKEPLLRWCLVWVLP